MTPTTAHRATSLLAAAGCVAACAWFVLVADERLLDPVVWLLTACVAVANRLSIRWRGRLWVSGSFAFSMVAASRYGPAAAFAVAAVGELLPWALERYRPTAAAINVLGSGVPNLVAATLFAAIVPAAGGDGMFVFGLLVAGTAAMTLNFLVVAGLTGLDTGELRRLRPPLSLLPCLVWNVTVTAVLALVLERSPAIVGASLVLLAVLGFTYMTRLSASGRRRAEVTATSSLGLVEGLVHSLEERDPSSARHAAAVARFSRDIARASGMSGRECGWAHLAGLLHDVGRVALSDQAVAGSGTLTAEDWAAIARHPALGADMLRMLGPVADAVRAHHERPDGLGYPDGLSGDDIPPLARIVAVAEVYDTLTAPDGYRGGMSSFEALRELRRVSGTQLDPQYVETLSQLLTGRPFADRHGAGADLDEELLVERRRIVAEPA